MKISHRNIKKQRDNQTKHEAFGLIKSLRLEMSFCENSGETILKLEMFAFICWLLF